MKVVDASALVEVLLGSPKSERLVAQLDDDLFAPDLLVCETLNSLRSMIRRGTLTDHEGFTLMGLLAAATIDYQSTRPYTARIWELRHELTSYDASYVALAEDLRAPLITTDIGLARAAERYVAVVVV